LIIKVYVHSWRLLLNTYLAYSTNS